MSPNNKRKRVNNIKGREKAHPYSRKARQIDRAMHKESQIAKTKSDRLSMALSRGQRLVWFRDNMDELTYSHEPDSPHISKSGKKVTWSMNDLGTLVAEFLKRHEEELEAIEEKKKAGKPVSSKDAFFLENVKAEKMEAEMSGLDVPDLTNGKIVKFMRTWDGDVNSVSNITTIKCKPVYGNKEDKDTQDGEDDEDVRRND
ncbi:translation machinery-associated protein 16 [Coemansia sp. Benny D115]|nr:translation machinery-associated protein 16 [Coemansia sp. Benny D115]